MNAPSSYHLKSATLVAVVLGLSATLCWSHYHFLVPASPVADPGDPVTFKFFFGHPFEHEITPCKSPLQVKAHPPGGDVVILKEAQKTEDAVEHAFPYTPQVRGDHIVTAEAAPIPEEDHGALIVDHVKVILHSLSQNGWDRKVGQPLEIVPLTRPYGLRPGWAFQAAVLLDGKPLEGAEIEVEKFSPSPPKGDLPEEEFVTRTARTAQGGAFTVTLDEKGWWGIQARVRRGQAKDAEGKERPVLLRTTLWIYVGEPLREAGKR